jgi:hypothetical protein
MLVLALVPCGFASSVSYGDGFAHDISGGTYGGINASNSSVVNISGGVIDGNIVVADGAIVRLSGGQIDGGLDVGNDCTKAFGQVSSVPEPSSLIALAGLGTMGLIYAWRRRKQMAARLP